MLKYCKIIDKEKGLIQVGLGTNEKFYKSIGFTLQEVEEIEGQYYLKGQVPEEILNDIKEKNKLKLKQELKEKFYKEYPIYKQCNIAIYGTNEERKKFKEFHDKIVEEYNNMLLIS